MAGQMNDYQQGFIEIFCSIIQAYPAYLLRSGYGSTSVRRNYSLKLIQQPGTKNPVIQQGFYTM